MTLTLTKKGRFHLCADTYHFIKFQRDTPKTVNTDLDLDPMTFLYELDLDIMEIYLYIKMKSIFQGIQKL